MNHQYCYEFDCLIDCLSYIDEVLDERVYAYQGAVIALNIQSIVRSIRNADYWIRKIQGGDKDAAQELLEDVKTRFLKKYSHWMTDNLIQELAATR